jgi:hypothetical protein
MAPGWDLHEPRQRPHWPLCLQQGTSLPERSAGPSRREASRGPRHRAAHPPGRQRGLPRHRRRPPQWAARAGVEDVRDAEGGPDVAGPDARRAGPWRARGSHRAPAPRHRRRVRGRHEERRRGAPAPGRRTSRASSAPTSRPLQRTSSPAWAGRPSTASSGATSRPWSTPSWPRARWRHPPSATPSSR